MVTARDEGPAGSVPLHYAMSALTLASKGRLIGYPHCDVFTHREAAEQAAENITGSERTEVPFLVRPVRFLPALAGSSDETLFVVKRRPLKSRAVVEYQGTKMLRVPEICSDPDNFFGFWALDSVACGPEAAASLVRSIFQETLERLSGVATAPGLDNYRSIAAASVVYARPARIFEDQEIL